MSRTGRAISLILAIAMMTGLMAVPSYAGELGDADNGIYTADKTTTGAAVADEACNDAYSKQSITFAAGAATESLELWWIVKGYRTTIQTLGEPVNQRHVYYGPQGSVAKLGTTNGIVVTQDVGINDKIEVTEDYLNSLVPGTYLFQMKDGADPPQNVGSHFTITVTGGANPSGNGFEADTTYIIDSQAGVHQYPDNKTNNAEKVTAVAPSAGDLKIDLSAETITIPEDKFKVEAYSLDGGKKWTAKSLTTGDISKLLNKGMELWLTDAYDKKAKGPQQGVEKVDAIAGVTPPVEAVAEVKVACLVKFPKIEARPAAEKLTINYLLGADTTGKTNGTWMLSAKGSDTAFDVSKLQGVQPAGKKFDASTDTWKKFLSTGVPVLAMENGKAVKTTYFYRLAPVVGATNVAASKTMKVTASSVVKAPGLKPDYKKEVLKTKKDMMFYFGPRDADTEEPGKSANTKGGVLILAETDAKPDTDKLKEKNAESKKFFGPVDPSDKDPINLGTYLSESETYITVWSNATAKKPASMKQEITLAPRAYLPNSVVAAEKGKVKLDKTLEVYDSGKSKYGKLPKPEAKISDLPIRLKNTAKAGKADKATATLKYDGLAASRDGAVDVSFGVYETKLDKKGDVRSKKEGFLEASIVAPAYAGRMALVNPKLKVGSNVVDKLYTDDTPVTVVYEVVTLDALDDGAGKIAGLAFSDNASSPAVAFSGYAVADAADNTKPTTVTATVGINKDGKVKVTPTKPTGYDDKTFYCAPLDFEITKHTIELAFTESSDKTKVNLKIKLDGTDTVPGTFEADGKLEDKLQYDHGQTTVTIDDTAYQTDGVTITKSNTPGSHTITVELADEGDGKHFEIKGTAEYTYKVEDSA